MDTLKPCPFCGSKPVHPEAMIDGMICCGNADCIAWTFPATIEQWNTRPLEDALLEAAIEVTSWGAGDTHGMGDLRAARARARCEA
jgi:hypothetical protein